MSKGKERNIVLGSSNGGHSVGPNCIRSGLDFGQHQSMTDIDACPDTLRLVREIHSPGLFKVLDLISRRS